LRRCGHGHKKATLADVAAVLNAEQRASRTGRSWTATMVRDLLGRP